jgi:transcriptional regulator with XRE-family HTH domain
LNREASLPADYVPSLVDLFLAAVGELAMTYRETAGLSLDDVAAKVGLTAEQLDDFEHGWVDLPISKLQAIASALGATATELLDISGSELGLTV